jgi:hypothetical protein
LSHPPADAHFVRVSMSAKNAGIAGHSAEAYDASSAPVRMWSVFHSMPHRRPWSAFGTGRSFRGAVESQNRLSVTGCAPANGMMALDRRIHFRP